MASCRILMRQGWRVSRRVLGGLGIRLPREVCVYSIERPSPSPFVAPRRWHTIASQPDIRSNIVDCAHRGPPGMYPNSKRIIVCCDGTWNNTNKRGSGPPSNVSRLSGAIARKCCTGKPQIVHYHPGVGTEETTISHYVGGAFGTGILPDIVENYRFICDNYNPGDEIVILGFSRGAFTARSVASMVCNLGFLNRTGIDELPNIFHDYHHWADWTSESKYDEKEYLCAFTLENYMRVLRLKAWREGGKLTKSMDEMKEELDREKREFFRKMTLQTVEGTEPGKKRMDLLKMADMYRDMLHEMSLAKRVHNGDIIDYAPIEGKVSVVGVWDTVGSLGLPRMQWAPSNRNDRELRFASLDVHPGVDYAFHALALDEWRTAFGPTLWSLHPDNKHTELRQVWFPGSHSNVGGGFEDQQIATIALAWMADQLTSVGVEFGRPEMQRIFYDVNSEAQSRPWGMGKIHNPSGATSIPDRVYDALPWRYFTGKQTPARTPGLYTHDGADDPLLNTKESVHPSVRIRYLYDGKGLDDEPQWPCRALTENGYTLVKQDVSSVAVRPSRVPHALKPYHTVGGSLIPFFDDVTTVQDQPPVLDGYPAPRFVRTEQPHENDLQTMADPTTYWAWRRGDTVLPEEQLGMWERMYIKINDKLVAWQAAAEERRAKVAEEEEAARRALMSPVMRKLEDLWAGAGEAVGEARSSGAREGRYDAESMPYKDEEWQKAGTTANPRRTWTWDAKGMNGLRLDTPIDEVAG
ncbi:uncharacterized protein DNG_02581 [Cephalotrichum gorgonifer]|uniref:T6SS Phospholipase effector Tle1-like catalytic domain-containing protein n=1 Tax=Cephalotrichum gorgonifer TaxID=2041049 RepID=A0AAE8MTG6_9PEZI|nr:uncharacterized protein DNG_02581 [Cephalotrichum gorgonifer]